jgi:protein-L-isoaspartate(D-aspartate) O-methyltransferase
VQKCALSVVRVRAINGTVGDMQCRDALGRCEIGVSSESLLAFVATVTTSFGHETVLPMQHGCARSLQAMGFMTLLPQSEEMRRNMVDSQLRTSGVNAPWILAAMLATPREAFVPGANSAVYMDRSFPLGSGRMLNPPLAAGQMLMVAEPSSNDRVLLIGAGTGYLAALLAKRVACLVAVEESPELAVSFAANLPYVDLLRSSHNAGAPDNAPFDLIIIDGAIAELPSALVDQLADGGRVVAGITDGPVSRLAAGVKRGNHLALRPVADMEIAALPGFARAKEFVF